MYLLTKHCRLKCLSKYLYYYNIYSNLLHIIVILFNHTTIALNIFNLHKLKS